MGKNPLEYYRKAINEGTILVNNKKVYPEYYLTDNDHIIEFIKNKKEPPIYDKDIKVV